MAADQLPEWAQDALARIDSFSEPAPEAKPIGDRVRFGVHDHADFQNFLETLKAKNSPLVSNNKIYKSDDESYDFLTTDIHTFLDLKFEYTFLRQREEEKEELQVHFPSIFLRGAASPPSAGSFWHCAPILPSTHVSIAFNFLPPVPPKYQNFPKAFYNTQVDLILKQLTNSPISILSQNQNRYSIHEADIQIGRDSLILNLSVINPAIISSLRDTLNLLDASVPIHNTNIISILSIRLPFDLIPPTQQKVFKNPLPEETEEIIIPTIYPLSFYDKNRLVKELERKFPPVLQPREHPILSPAQAFIYQTRKYLAKRILGQTIDEQFCFQQEIYTRQATITRSRPDSSPNPLTITLKAHRHCIGDALVFIMTQCINKNDIVYTNSQRPDRLHFRPTPISAKIPFCTHCGCTAHTLQHCPTNTSSKRQQRVIPECYSWKQNKRCYRLECRYAHFDTNGRPLSPQEIRHQSAAHPSRLPHNAAAASPAQTLPRVNVASVPLASQQPRVNAVSAPFTSQKHRASVVSAPLAPQQIAPPALSYSQAANRSNHPNHPNPSLQTSSAAAAPPTPSLPPALPALQQPIPTASASPADPLSTNSKPLTKKRQRPEDSPDRSVELERPEREEGRLQCSNWGSMDVGVEDGETSEKDVDATLSLNE